MTTRDMRGTMNLGGNARSVVAPASPEPTVVPRIGGASLMPICTNSTPSPSKATGKIVNSAAFTVDHPLAQVAIDWHRNQDGEYGCNGITCPAVQRLISFGELCAWTWNIADPALSSAPSPQPPTSGGDR